MSLDNLRLLLADLERHQRKLRAVFGPIVDQQRQLAARVRATSGLIAEQTKLPTIRDERFERLLAWLDTPEWRDFWKEMKKIKERDPEAWAGMIGDKLPKEVWAARRSLRAPPLKRGRPKGMTKATAERVAR